MTPAEFLDQEWWGNPVSRWLVALGTSLLVVVALWPLKRYVVRRLQDIAGSTETAIDDLVVQILRATKPLLVLLFALWVGSRVLVLPTPLSQFLSKAAIIAVVLQIGVWASRALVGWLEILRQRRAVEGEVLTWLSGVEWGGKALIWTAALLIGLENLGVDITGLVTGLGIGGIAVALAAQNVLGDLFSAFAIYIDRPFVIGDFIKVGDQLGTVESIGMKTTRLRSLTGEQLVFGNSDLVGSRIQNFGRLDERRAAFLVGVTYDTAQEKLEEIPRLIREAVEAQEQVRFDRSHFREFGDSALVFETVYFVLVPDFAVKMDVQQAINLELKRCFDSQGIEFAFPTQTIYLEGTESA